MRCKFDAAVADIALPDPVQVEIVEYERIEIREHRRIRETADRNDERTSLERLDGVRPPYERLWLSLELR
jgi:hypothetical protein